MKQNNRNCTKDTPVQWDTIDTVLLDMDGTLLDKYFDDYFWEEYVVEKYAKQNNFTFDEAKEKLLARYKAVENTLAWTDLGYWSNELQLNMPKLKEETAHLINILPSSLDFLSFLKRQNKQIYLVTNAPPYSLSLKMQKTGIRSYFDTIVCSAEIGKAKEQPAFWTELQKKLQFNPENSILFDDTEKVLETASAFGISTVIHIAKGSSKKPAAFSSTHLSIDSFFKLL